MLLWQIPLGSTWYDIAHFLSGSTMVNVDPRHHTTCPSSRNYYHECGEESYDRAVAWCREAISSVGRDNDMLFSPRAFHREIASASSRFGMPFEVSREVWMHGG